MTAYKGFVKKIHVRDVTVKGRASKSYSFILDDKGTESGFINFGFDKAPPFVEGDYVECEAAPNAKGYLHYTAGTGRIVKDPPKEAVVVQQTQQSDKAAADVARQASIQYQSARKDAIEVMALLLDKKAFPHSAAATKAGEALRFEEILAGVDKLTVRFYHDTDTLRRLESVADEVNVQTTPVISADEAVEDVEQDSTEISQNGGVSF